MNESKIVAALGKVENAVNDIRNDLTNFEGRTHTRFDSIDRRLDSHDQRFDSQDQKFASMEARFDSHDQKFSSLGTKFESHDQKFISIESRFNSLEKQFQFQRVDIIEVKELVLGAI